MKSPPCFDSCWILRPSIHGAAISGMKHRNHDSFRQSIQVIDLSPQLVFVKPRLQVKKKKCGLVMIDKAFLSRRVLCFPFTPPALTNRLSQKKGGRELGRGTIDEIRDRNFM
ncbi:hypothetical protein L249_7760 [Ophiocordyceps polyrhachis-furcata BCC 54312]|uniref:Uncharacterized protein n=1 Tax=Ophiocordyceps polyrhachis-furcata BCC 54312 TaxID=1330021 RepID=A0A367L9Y3_9HYPO|nr:hypothetical protein L249_7760 [Ophiocordyceps polyrhachis-furcata BCC 54312]